MTDAQFLNAVALGQVTPGPVVATVAAVGYAAHGVGGAPARGRGRLRALLLLHPARRRPLRAAARKRPGPGISRRRRDRRRSARSSAPPSPWPAALHEGWQFGVLAAAAVALLVVRRGVVETLVVAGAVGAGSRLGRSAPALSWSHGGGHRHDGQSRRASARPRSSLLGRLIQDQHRQSARQRGPGPGVPQGLADRRGLRVRAARGRARSPQPGRPPPRSDRRPDAHLPGSRRHRPRGLR